MGSPQNPTLRWKEANLQFFPKAYCLAKLPVDRMSWFNLQINIVRALEIICCSSPAWVPCVFAIRRKEVVSGHARCFPAELQITTPNISCPYWRTITTSAGSTVTWIDSSWCQLDLYRLSLTHYDGLIVRVQTSLTFAVLYPCYRWGCFFCEWDPLKIQRVEILV